MEQQPLWSRESPAPPFSEENRVETVCAAGRLGSGSALSGGVVPAARAGEAWALEALFLTHRDAVYTVAARLTGRSEDAEDVTQAVFIRAFRELHRFRGDASVRTWIYRIAVNEALGMLRKRRDAVPLPEPSALPGGDAVQEEAVAVRAALRELPHPARVVLILHYWEGLSVQEIADVLGLSLSAAKMRLHRARGEFRRRFEVPA